MLLIWPFLFFKPWHGRRLCAALLALGCNYFQGYLFGRPMAMAPA